MKNIINFVKATVNAYRTVQAAEMEAYKAEYMNIFQLLGGAN